jgi:PAS domain S-box-containing protein
VAIHSTPSDRAVLRQAEQHLVQFYASEGFLAGEVTRFLAEGLSAGEPAVVIATQAHRDLFLRHLQARAIDVAHLVESKRLVMLDAEATLAEFMVAGAPEPERFEHVVGGVLAKLGATTPGNSICAYGEMVDLLWRRGQQDAAIRLEELWNELRSRYDFRLLCAYVIDSFYKEGGIPRICATHSHVLAPERIEDPANMGHLLQSLVGEIAHRTEVEHQLREALSRARRAEETAKLAVADLEDILENAAIAIHRVDRDGIIRWANRAELELLGYEPHEYIGRHIAEFHVDQPVIDDILTRLTCGGTLHDREARVRTKSGDIRILQISSNFQRKDGGTTRCFSRDVTDQKRAQQAAEQASRAKDEFLAILGHELRNPLSPILTAVQLMRLRGETASAREHNIIERQVKHLIHIVDDLLDLSRVARGKIELAKAPVNLRSLVTKAVEITSPLLESRSHHVDIVQPDGDIWLEADETRLCQVLTNLLSNAAKYTPPHGHIELRVTRDGGRVVIRVRDNGVGIEPELLPRVFDLFVQGERTHEHPQGGLGIGLALVRNLVSLHGGSTSAHSEGRGTGSEFTVELPIIDMGNVATSAQDHELDLRQRVHVTPRRILVVDDNEDAGELLAELLRKIGHEVVTASDGPRALEAAKRFTPEVAILDIGLPVMNGYELCAALRERLGSTVRLVAVSGYGQDKDQRRALKAGFECLLVKPVSLQRVLAAIEVDAASLRG